MPVRPTVSPLEAAIIPQVRSYLNSRSAELASKKSSTPEEGIDMLTDAIAIAVNAALSSPALQATFAAIIDTNAAVVTPIGQIAYSTAMTPATAPSVPNPLKVPQGLGVI